MLVIIVTGSRNWTDEKAIVEALLREEQTSMTECHIWKADEPFITLVHGNARGADQLAGEIASGFGYKVISVPAEWDRYGKKSPERSILAAKHLAARFDQILEKGQSALIGSEDGVIGLDPEIAARLNTKGGKS